MAVYTSYSSMSFAEILNRTVEQRDQYMSPPWQSCEVVAKIVLINGAPSWILTLTKVVPSNTGCTLIYKVAFLILLHTHTAGELLFSLTKSTTLSLVQVELRVLRQTASMSILTLSCRYFIYLLPCKDGFFVLCCCPRRPPKMTQVEILSHWWRSILAERLRELWCWCSFLPSRRTRGRPRYKCVLLPHVRGQRGPGGHGRQRYEGGRGEPDQELRADSQPAPHGASSTQKFGHAPGEENRDELEEEVEVKMMTLSITSTFFSVSNDVLACPGWPVHDHEVLVKLSHLPPDREHVPPAAPPVRSHHHGQPALRRQSLELQLRR